MFNKIYVKIKEFIADYYKYIIAIIIVAFLGFYELPYVIYTPGGIVSLESRIEIEDKNEFAGSLNMSYVSMKKGIIPMILLSYVIPNWDLTKEEFNNRDENIDDALKLYRLQLASSIDNATILAYKKAEKSLNITKNVNNIIYIDRKAKTDLKECDELISVEKNEIGSIEDLRKIINEKKVGDKVNIKVKRDDKEIDCSAEVYEASDGLKIGIAFLTTYEYETDPAIEIKTKSNESGSSGGLMLSLAIYNALTKEDITNGKKIVGTGTINVDGKVGKIDGIKYKLLGAQKNKADLFLCPPENYDEALKVKKEYNLKLNIKSVATFDDAINILKNI